MANNILALFDKDEEYVMQLMNFFSLTKPVELEIQGFTDIAHLKSFAEEKKISILLVQSSCLCDEIEEMHIGEIMVLSEGEYESRDLMGHKSVYKYQSGENIMREVMCYYAEEPAEIVKNFKNGSQHMIGVYSPVKRCLKTSFALALGEILSHEGKTLYVNMEDYHGFNSLIGENFMADISDLLFYISQNKKNFPCKLASMVVKMGELDFIPPTICPEDLKGPTQDDWMNFFAELSATGYENIIIDVGEGIRDLPELLDHFTTIYMPVRDDIRSKAKIEQFEATLRIMEYQGVLDKLVKIDFPYF
nr:hypothetical protein [Lachnospiraceae bacterium]